MTVFISILIPCKGRTIHIIPPEHHCEFRTLYSFILLAHFLLQVNGLAHKIELQKRKRKERLDKWRELTGWVDVPPLGRTLKKDRRLINIHKHPARAPTPRGGSLMADIQNFIATVRLGYLLLWFSIRLKQGFWFLTFVYLNTIFLTAGLVFFLPLYVLVKWMLIDFVLIRICTNLVLLSSSLSFGVDSRMFLDESRVFHKMIFFGR
jgi:hypothetical protein